MPSKYGKEFAVPKEFPSILKAFSREVLRSQPDNIWEFGATYFTELVNEANAAGQAVSNQRMSTEELAELLHRLFVDADVDGSGALSSKEFETVLRAAELHLSDREIKRVLAEADTDGNGEVSYEEFIPIGVELVNSIQVANDVADENLAMEEDARQQAEYHLFHGMTKEELERLLVDVFQRADVDNSGALSYDEFRQACKDADIGLTRQEINLLLHQVDADQDGVISYTEFVPVCFEMLVEMLKDDILRHREPSDIEVFFLEKCEDKDFRRKGVLDAIELKEALKACDLGLTKLQMHSILNQATYNVEGMVEYAKFAPTAASLIYKLLDYENMLEMREHQDRLRAAADYVPGYVNGVNEEQIIASLNEAFALVDPQGEGFVKTVDELVSALKGCSLNLTDNEMMTLLSLAESDGDKIYYQSLIESAFLVLEYLATSM